MCVRIFCSLSCLFVCLLLCYIHCLSAQLFITLFLLGNKVPEPEKKAALDTKPIAPPKGTYCVPGFFLCLSVYLSVLGLCLLFMLFDFWYLHCICFLLLSSWTRKESSWKDPCAREKGSCSSQRYCLLVRLSNSFTPHACVFCLFILCLWSVSICTVIHHFFDLETLPFKVPTPEKKPSPETAPKKVSPPEGTLFT